LFQTNHVIAPAHTERRNGYRADRAMELMEVEATVTHWMHLVLHRSVLNAQ